MCESIYVCVFIPQYVCKKFEYCVQLCCYLFQLLGENLYVRQDGTLSYYFGVKDIHKMCIGVGLMKVENEYILRQYANRKQSQARYRVWIHAKYEKPV